MSEETDHNSPEKEKNNCEYPALVHGKPTLNMFMLTDLIGHPSPGWLMDREGNIRFPGPCPLTGASERPPFARVRMKHINTNVAYLIEYAPEILNLFLKEREKNELLRKQVRAYREMLDYKTGKED